MKKHLFLVAAIGLLVMVGCGKKQATSETPKDKTADTSQKVVKNNQRRNIVNNVVVGNTKVSFNNDSFDIMSDGKFSAHELWGTFKGKDFPDTYVQLNASDTTTPAYGTVAEYQLADVEWGKNEIIQQLGVTEEATQTSKDGKVKLYKARTGDIILSVAIFSTKKLTDKELKALDGIVQGIELDYAAG